MWNVKILALIPLIFSSVLQIEADVTGLKGPAKRAAALDLVLTGIRLADGVTGHPIVPNEAALIAAIGPVVDAIVDALNTAQAAQVA